MSIKQDLTAVNVALKKRICGANNIISYSILSLVNWMLIVIKSFMGIPTIKKPKCNVHIISGKKMHFLWHIISFSNQSYPFINFYTINFETVQKSPYKKYLVINYLNKQLPHTHTPWIKSMIKKYCCRMRNSLKIICCSTCTRTLRVNHKSIICFFIFQTVSHNYSFF